MLFSEIIGQEEVKNKLRQSIHSGRIPHAQLFYGPQGSGSLAMAIAYAQYIACNNRSESDSCGECPSCKKFMHLAHPDLHFVFPVNTSKTIKKDPVSDDYIALWREQLMESPYFLSGQWYNRIGIENKQGFISRKESESISRKLSLKSFESEYKFLILWLPEKMNTTSANMLLKLIEEPPEKTLFLMVSEQPEQVLITISSRTQPVKLERIDKETLALALEKSKGIGKEEALSVARLANGSYIDALDILDSSEESIFYFEQFTSFMRLCYQRNIPDLNMWVENMSGIGRERLKSFFEYALRLIRENFILNLKKNDLVYLTKQEEEFSQRFHPFINGRNILAISEELNAASADIERNGNGKIVLFDMSLKVVKLIRR